MIYIIINFKEARFDSNWDKGSIILAIFMFISIIIFYIILT